LADRTGAIRIPPQAGTRTAVLKIGVISDIHSNLEGLKAALEYLDGKVDKIHCLGDIVGYGACPNECLELVRETNDVSIRGNHDSATIDLMLSIGFNPIAKEAVYWTREILSDENLRWLKSLKEAEDTEFSHLAHGSLKDPLIYIFCEYDARESFQYQTKQVAFIGHTHVAEYYQLDGESEKISRTECYNGGLIKLEEGCKYLINVGSVGQPRDGNPELSLAVFDVENGEVEIVRLPYDVEGAARQIIEVGLPERLATRLYSGR
jgi:predicted phosphodiesterase